MIHHVSLETRPADVDAALAFWALLGFTRVDPPPSLAARAAWMAHGPSQIHLLYADEPTAMPEGHVAVVLDDYPATLARLRAAGFTPEPRRGIGSTHPPRAPTPSRPAGIGSSSWPRRLHRRNPSQNEVGGWCG